MDHELRNKKITQTAMIGIVVNLVVAGVKIVLGLLANSIAIISEGVNNATDAGSSFLTLIGTKLSSKHPDKDHPFGYGRIEYLTGLVVGMLILYTGIGMLREAVESALAPADMDVTVLAIGIVAFTAVVKLFLALYTIKVGKDTESDALIAVGTECRADSAFSVVTILSSAVYLLFHISLDAYAGMIFAVIIIKAGYDTLKSTTSEIIGTAGKKELALELYKEIRGTEGIISAADMILHNYGPDQYTGSVNVEIDHKMSIGEAYEFLHELQLRIMHEYQVTMVFGIYAVDYDTPDSKKLRKVIGQFVKDTEHIKSYHAVYFSEKTKTIYCDFIVDYELKDWEQTKKDFLSYMEKEYAGIPVELTIETDFIA